VVACILCQTDAPTPALTRTASKGEETESKTDPATVDKPAHDSVALLFDAGLVGVLMMGNLSPGLKGHAVTMFEVGRLSYSTVCKFLDELFKVRLVPAVLFVSLSVHVGNTMTKRYPLPVTRYLFR